jgi:hypothetical protein
MDTETIQLIADQIERMLKERNLENNHDNRTICMKEILDDLTNRGIIASYTWTSDGNIRLNLGKH